MFSNHLRQDFSNLLIQTLVRGPVYYRQDNYNKSFKKIFYFFVMLKMLYLSTVSKKYLFSLYSNVQYRSQVIYLQYAGTSYSIILSSVKKITRGYASSGPRTRVHKNTLSFCSRTRQIITSEYKNNTRTRTGEISSN